MARVAWSVVSRLVLTLLLLECRNFTRIHSFIWDSIKETFFEEAICIHIKEGSALKEAACVHASTSPSCWRNKDIYPFRFQLLICMMDTGCRKLGLEHLSSFRLWQQKQRISLKPSLPDKWMPGVVESITTFVISVFFKIIIWIGVRCVPASI
jgi:hypothetical protein